MNHIYRFRPLHALLDGYHELENQEIYFASLDELNDPMEGFTDIIWQGDRVVWENLLRHYINCLDHVCGFLAIAGEAHRLGWKDLPVVRFDPRCNAQRKALEDDIVRVFLDDAGVRSIVDALVSRGQPVRRNELYVYLRHLHAFALSVVYQYYERHGLMPAQAVVGEMIEQGRRILSDMTRSIPMMEKIEATHLQLPSLDPSPHSVSNPQPPCRRRTQPEPRRCPPSIPRSKRPATSRRCSPPPGAPTTKFVN